MRRDPLQSEPSIMLGAEQLVRARQNGGALDDLPKGSKPRTLAEGYAMQRQATVAWSDKIAGWKVGATAASVQSLFGISEPIFGPVFAKTVFQSPCFLRARDFQHLLIEAELAFLFSKQLVPKKSPYTREQIHDAIEAVAPAFEIVSPRFKKLPSDRLPQLVADFSANAGAVLGRTYTDWRLIDFAAQSVSLSANGFLRERGTGALALGNPLNVLDWLVNAFSSHMIPVEAGQFVLTGTLTGMYLARTNEVCVADFGDLGTVEVVFE